MGHRNRALHYFKEWGIQLFDSHPNAILGFPVKWNQFRSLASLPALQPLHPYRLCQGPAVGAAALYEAVLWALLLLPAPRPHPGHPGGAEEQCHARARARHRGLLQPGKWPLSPAASPAWAGRVSTCLFLFHRGCSVSSGGTR